MEAEANAVRSALAVQRSLGNAPRNKTIAGIEGGSRTLSGWTPQPGYIQATEQVMARAKEIGHQLKPAGPLDKGVPGRYNASHAEKQASALHPNKPIGVSSEMCLDCQEYFKALARHTGNTQVVADPKVVRLFRPDGSVDELPNTLET